jgi:hypothetical protein
MAESLTTIATFSDLLQADLARNDLQAAGIEFFLVGEAFASVAWHLTTAVHGIRLQVPTADAEQARAILSAPARHGMDEDASGDTTSSGADAEVDHEHGPDETGHEKREERDSTEEPEDLTRREQTADRAFRGAVFGLICPPLQLYIFWLLLKVLVSEERLSHPSRNRALWAAAINLPLMFLFLLWLKTLMPPVGIARP